MAIAVSFKKLKNKWLEKTDLVVTSDHDDSNTSFVAGFDGGLDFSSWGIEHTANTDEGDV